MIEAVSSSGSFLDGGGSKPLQRSAVPLLAPEAGARRDRGHPRGVPAASGAILREGLREAGVRFDLEPEGTFYCWGDVSALPAALNDGMAFFRAALGATGDLRAGRVLRRESGQAPERAAVAVPALRAVLVRAGGSGGGGGGQADSGRWWPNDEQ